MWCSSLKGYLHDQGEKPQEKLTTEFFFLALLAIKFTDLLLTASGLTGR